MMPARLREIVEIVLVEIHAARRNFVQQRLPQMRAGAVDERHARATLAAQPVAEPRGELETAGAAADDHDAMTFRVRHTGCSDSGTAAQRCPLSELVAACCSSFSIAAALSKVS